MLKAKKELVNFLNIIYLWGVEGVGERESQSCFRWVRSHSAEPDAGLSGLMSSWSELKSSQVLNRLSHPGVLELVNFDHFGVWKWCVIIYCWERNGWCLFAGIVIIWAFTERAVIVPKTECPHTHKF